jgi:hypothetical protein
MAYDANKYDRMSMPQNAVVCVVHFEDGRAIECASWRGAELQIEAEYPGATIERRGAARIIDGQRVAVIRAA